MWRAKARDVEELNKNHGRGERYQGQVDASIRANTKHADELEAAIKADEAALPPEPTRANPPEGCHWTGLQCCLEADDGSWHVTLTDMGTLSVDGAPIEYINYALAIWRGEGRLGNGDE